jgi:hypothetical protein
MAIPVERGSVGFGRVSRPRFRPPIAARSPRTAWRYALEAWSSWRERRRIPWPRRVRARRRRRRRGSAIPRTVPCDTS